MDFEIDDAGDMYWKPTEEGDERVCVNLPENTSQGVMGLLNGSLGLWFDAYQELEEAMGLDLQQRLLAIMASVKTQKATEVERNTAQWSRWRTTWETSAVTEAVAEFVAVADSPPKSAVISSPVTRCITRKRS